MPDRETSKRNVSNYFTQINEDWVSSDSHVLWYTTDSLWSVLQHRDMALRQTSSATNKRGVIVSFMMLLGRVVLLPRDKLVKNDVWLMPQYYNKTDVYFMVYSPLLRVWRTTTQKKAINTRSCYMTHKSVHTTIRYLSSNLVSYAPHDYRWCGLMGNETVVSGVLARVDIVGASCARERNA